MSAINRADLTSSFPTPMPSLPFCCLIVLARTSPTMWNRSGDSGHTRLVIDREGREKVVFKML